MDRADHQHRCLHPVVVRVGSVRQFEPRLPDDGEPCLARIGPRLQARRRRSLDALRPADHLPAAVLHRVGLAGDPLPRQGVHDLLPRPRDGADRRLRLARRGTVLSFLRGRPHPDVPHHRHLGRQAAHLCVDEILPLYAARLVADAARHHEDVWHRRHNRHPDAATHQVPGVVAILALARLLRLVRGQDADVAGPHVASGRSRRGADGRLRRAGGRTAEARWLRHAAFLAADVPRRRRITSRRWSSPCRSSRSSTRRWWRSCRRT